MDCFMASASKNRNMDTVEMRAATPDDARAVEDYHDRCFRKDVFLAAARWRV